MKLLIIPKPMFNKDMAVMSYCFRFQKSDAFLNVQTASLADGAMRSPCMEVLCEVGLDAFTNGLPIFVPINKFALLADVEKQCPEPASKIIFLIDDTVPPEEPFLSSIKRLKELGYRMALEKVGDFGKVLPIVELCEFIFISCHKSRFKNAMSILQNKFKQLSFVATDVDSMDLFEKVKNENFVSFEGKFYSIPITKGEKEVSPVKANYIRLLNIVRNDDFDIGEVAKIIGQDTSLSIALLRLVNSPYIGLAQKIKTIKHAVALLGQKEVRKWVTTAVARFLYSDKPDEITKLSLVRAKFAENLSKIFAMPTHAESLYLMGLFSILDVVLEKPIADALKVVQVSDKIRNALVDMKGDYAKVLEFIYTYEKANWNEISRLMILNNLDGEDIFKAYIEAVTWYRSIAAVGED